MSRSGDIARVLSDPRLTPERVSAYLRTTGLHDTAHYATAYYRRRNAWFPITNRVSTFRPWDGHAEYDAIEIIAQAEDRWWLDTAAAILAHPLQGEEPATQPALRTVRSGEETKP